MNALDWIIIGVGLISVVRGLIRGAVSQIFGIAGVLSGFLVASHFYESLAVQLARSFPSLSGVPAISFIVLFFLAWFCVAIVGFWIGTILHRTGLGFLDRLWGGILGVGKALVVSIILISILTFFLSPSNALVAQSLLVPYVHEATRLVVQATPESVQRKYEDKRKEFDRYWQDKRDGLPGMRPSDKRDTRGHLWKM